MTEPAHTPTRPSWDCRACGKDWPCNSARETLVAEAIQDGSPSQLGMLMWGYLEDFSLDVGSQGLTGAYERFLAWTWPASC